jgi:hypothetical protein
MAHVAESWAERAHKFGSEAQGIGDAIPASISLLRAAQEEKKVSGK